MVDEQRMDKNFRDFDLFFKHNIQEAKNAVNQADFWTKKRESYSEPIDQASRQLYEKSRFI